MGKKILIADDDHGILEVLQLTLESEGYEVEVTDNGQEVINRTSNWPNLFLLDVWMGNSDGRDICNTLKSRPETKDIPVIMISANHETNESTRAAGADDFLPKPFEVTDLLQKVTLCLNKN